MDEFDLADTESRRGILERMYSTEGNNNGTYFDSHLVVFIIYTIYTYARFL